MQENKKLFQKRSGGIRKYLVEKLIPQLLTSKGFKEIEADKDTIFFEDENIVIKVEWKEYES